MGELLDIYENNDAIKRECDKNWITLPKYDSGERWRRPLRGEIVGRGPEGLLVRLPPGHCYIECFYEDFFRDYKEKEGNLLEIGVEYSAMSLLLWYLYFSKMKIYGIDIKDRKQMFSRAPSLKERITINQFDSTELSSELKCYVKNNLKNFDLIIDDGDHNWKSQFKTAINLFPTLKDNGVYIIEDISCPIDLHRTLLAKLPINIEIHDNRDVGNPEEEIIFEIRKK